MTKFFAILAIIILSLVPARLFADDFSSKVDLKEFRKVTVQDRQTLKTFETFSRQAISTITGKSSLEGQDPVYTIFDIACRPELYESKNIIKIRNAVLRQDMQQLTSLSIEERQRIAKDGTISLKLWRSPEMQALVTKLQSQAIFKAKPIGELNEAAMLLEGLSTAFPAVAIIPPAPNSGSHKWLGFGEVVGNVAELNEAAKADGRTPPAPVPGYDNAVIGDVVIRMVGALVMWQRQDVAAVNEELNHVSHLLPTINPAEYPSTLNRGVEIIYNKLAKLTIPGAFLYFAAFVCFLVSARSGLVGVRLWGLRLFILAFVVHSLGIGIRWWLVATQHDSWFDGIPIKNQFESVLMSAWFGAMIALILEMRFGRSIFGAAGGFVGWLSLVAIFSAPYVTGVEIGGEIGQVAGVLMSYWLYIHVTMVTASYALITMGFGLSVWWLANYYRNYGTFARRPARQLSSDVIDLDAMPAGISGGSIQLNNSVLYTLARVMFVPVRARSENASEVSAKTAAPTLPYDTTGDAGARFLATVDACNLVVLQLAFWTLGIGIILGAIWADQSWGRPWGWDPKETFALVTWIVYLVVVHVRVATADKAWWTAVLSVVGFFIMLFNWIGVNFFLVGLHSYA